MFRKTLKMGLEKMRERLLRLRRNNERVCTVFVLVIFTSKNAGTVVCPSVCLSVTRPYSVETAKHIIKLLSPSGSHTILIFAYQTIWQYSDRDPIAGASNVGGMKSRDFRLLSRFISETIQDKSYSYNGRLIVTRMLFIEWRHCQ